MSNDADDESADDGSDPALMATQLVVMKALEELDTFLEAHPAMSSAGLSGMAVSLADATATLSWVGDVPVELADVISATANRHGITFSIRPARFTRDEIDAATRQIMAETDGFLRTAPESDGSGIRVTIDLDVFADPNARRSTHPAVTDFVPGGGDGDYAAIQAESNAERSVALPEAAQMWADFPSDQHPRPLVMLWPACCVSGHTTRSAKEAGRKGYTIGPGIPQAAGDAICRAGLITNDPSDDTGQITAARLTTYAFMTDRGSQDLRAWDLTITHTIGPNHLLTSEEQARDWVPPGFAERIHVAQPEAWIDPDDRTLVYTFFGDTEEVSDVAAIEIVETAGSVGVFPRLQYRPGGWRHRPLGLRSRRIAITLPTPLSGRVLVDDRGVPVIVTPRQPAGA